MLLPVTAPGLGLELELALKGLGLGLGKVVSMSWYIGMHLSYSLRRPEGGGGGGGGGGGVDERMY